MTPFKKEIGEENEGVLHWAKSKNSFPCQMETSKGFKYRYLYSFFLAHVLSSGDQSQ